MTDQTADLARLTTRVIHLLLSQPGQHTSASLARELGATHVRVARVVRSVEAEWGPIRDSERGPITLRLPAQTL